MSTWFTETLYADHAQRLGIQRILYREQSDQQDLLIFENPRFGRVLALDGVVQTTEADEYVYHEMLTHVPVLAHGSVRQVLIIGGGDGGMLRETLRHAVERVTMVEIDRQVVDICKKYLPSLSNGAFEDARTNLVIADGARFVRETQDRYDVIIIDSTDPIGPGEVLFSEDFYRACHGCLTPGGVVVTQNGVPFYQPDELRNSYRRLGACFADVSFYVATVPTYAGGFMAFGWASDNAALRTVSLETLEPRLAQAGFKTRYYTPRVHQAAFALPRFIEDELAIRDDAM